MADDVLRIKRGSTSPFLIIDVAGATGPADLSAASKVHLTGRFEGVNRIDTDLAVRPADGAVVYQWAAGDLATEGWWRFELAVTSGGKVTKYPTVVVQVTDSLTP